MLSRAVLILMRVGLLAAAVPIVPVVCENYHRLFDGKRIFNRGTLKIKSE